MGKCSICHETGHNSRSPKHKGEARFQKKRERAISPAFEQKKEFPTLKKLSKDELKALPW